MKRSGRSGGRRWRPALWGLLAALPLAASPPAALPAAAETAWGACLDCHEDPDLELTTAAGETLRLGVSPDELEASPHRELECRDCHEEVRLDEHPGDREVASIETWRAEAGRACRQCHSAGDFDRVPHHEPLAAAGAQPGCTGCHGAHGVLPVARWREAAGPNGYCLGCHGRGAAVPEPSGQAARLLDVDAGGLAGSVHAGHDCSDCHADYSASSHPGSGGEGETARRLAASRICAGCHDDKFEQVQGSVHFALLRAGSPLAPGCGDCHEPHAVAPRERYATLTGTPCRRCHDAIFEAYASSMHGVARANGGHLAAPLCSDCHRAHDVNGTARPELVREACGGCHPQAAAAHTAWLPNAALHLGAVACVACHAPEGERAVGLRVVDAASGRTLTVEEVTRLLGSDAAAFLEHGGEGVDGLDLWSALRRIGGEPGASAVALEGRLEVPHGAEAHRLRPKSGAVRRCETCHTAGSFGQVAVRLVDGEGRPRRVAAAPEVLVSPASVVPIRGFYALGATRIRVLDWLLVLAVLGGLTVPAVHGGARLLAARRARAGRAGEGR